MYTFCFMEEIKWGMRSLSKFSKVKYQLSESKDENSDKLPNPLS